MKLNDKQIPNGTAIHVLGEKAGQIIMNGRIPIPWNEWICSDGRFESGYRDEAIDKEYNTFGGKDVISK